MAEAQAYYDKQKLLADNEAEIILKNAEARLTVAERKCEALGQEADAELSNQDDL